MVSTLERPAVIWQQVREDFPVLNSTNARGQRLAFLDSAASSQKPESVLRALDAYYRESNANIHRGVYDLSERATQQYEAARSGLVNAFVRAIGVICQEMPHLSLHQPHSLS